MESVEAPARAFGGQSMWAPLRRVMVRRPAPPATPDDWRAFGFLHPVDHNLAEREHAAFRALLTEAGVEVIEGGPDAPGQLDAIFAYDPSLITDHGAILLRMGKEPRRQETAFHAETYRELGIPIIGQIVAPGTVEGGDCFWLDEGTLAVGRGYRTNEHGISQLRSLLAPYGIAVLAYDLPHWRGASECLHLMSLVSPVAPDLAVVFPPLLPVALMQELIERSWRLVEVPEEEFDSLGCNVLALAPGHCVLREDNPVTQRCLVEAGCEVREYKGDEISLNRAGGPTCLTRPLLREADRDG
ncbi:MAG: arginine deiminase [Chloroflexota bacterium]